MIVRYSARKMNRLVLSTALWFGVGQHISGQSSSVGASARHFEVATIKPNESNGPPIIRPLPDGIHATNVTALDLIRDAYGPLLPEDNRISGSPGWAVADKYDVEARIGDSDVQDFVRLSPDQRSAVLQLMLQDLLAERFHLGLHKVNRDSPVYVLEISRSGLKVEEGVTDDLELPNGRLMAQRGSIVGKGVSIQRLAALISQRIKFPVDDKTALPGRYDFSLSWETEENAASADERQTSGPESVEPLIAAAMQQQLGLTLRLTKRLVECFNIDHIDRPTQN